MSRIGKLPIEIPAGIEVNIKGNEINIKGPKGALSLNFNPEINVKVEDNLIIVTRNNDQKKSKALHGLIRSLVSNLIIGVSKGFEKKLEIHGVGYRAEGGGNKITLHLGFSHPVNLETPEGVSIELDKKEKNLLIITGIDKQKVGQFAAEIRKLRKPEPYKGKGIRYRGEYVPRKAGKKAGSK